MTELFDDRRYLTDFDSRRTGHLFADVLVIGSGVAGARAAIEATHHVDNVLLIAKASFRESSTHYAQGGVAAVRGEDDSTQRHIDDTTRVGGGLNRGAAVELVVNEANERIDELIAWGMRFDESGGAYALTREGGHSVSRVLHSQGDATGREMVRVLNAQVRANERIRVFENCFLIDLLTEGNSCVGAVTFHRKHGHQLIRARRTILAAGGAGRVFRETSNPAVVTGDGFASAYRAGAALADIEMVQFHPTTLYVAGSTRPLISEAVRGEGAYLVDRGGERFMTAFHPDGELAPRDVVSRAIYRRIRETRANCVYLDVRHLGKAKFVARFPGIAKVCAGFQIDVGKELIPVRPAAHYMVGGVVTDLDGKTDVDGLLCCGEVACTGLHGANRLASNSLLEGLVFGAIAGRTAGQTAGGDPARSGESIASENPSSDRTPLDLGDIANSLKSLMWRNVGIERCGKRLSETADIIDFWGHYVLDKTFDDVAGWEMQNMLSISRLISTAALERSVSLGVHYRTDGPGTDIDEAPSHIVLKRGADGLRAYRADVDFNLLADVP